MTENQSIKDSHGVQRKQKRTRSVEEFENLLAELQSIETENNPMSPKRPRRTYDDKELQKLESLFALKAYPDKNYRNELAKEMNVSPKNIQIWFQNRRARERLLRRKAEGVVENPIDRMRIQLAQSPHNVKPRFPTTISTMQKEDRHPMTNITNLQSTMQQGASHQQSHIKCNQLPYIKVKPNLDCRNSQENIYEINHLVGTSFEQVINEDVSNSQATLPQNSQQSPESYSNLQSTMQQGASHQQSHIKCNQLPYIKVEPNLDCRNSPENIYEINHIVGTSFEQVINEDVSNSQETLPQNSQLSPESIIVPSEMHLAVVSPMHFRSSVFNIPNLSETNEDLSNSQETLPQNSQQSPESCSVPNEIHVAVVPPRRFRTSVFSFSNLSEISNTSFSNLLEATGMMDPESFTNISPSCDFVFDF